MQLGGKEASACHGKRRTHALRAEDVERRLATLRPDAAGHDQPARLEGVAGRGEIAPLRRVAGELAQVVAFHSRFDSIGHHFLG